MNLNTAVSLIEAIDIQPRNLTDGEQAAILDLGQRIADRIPTRAAATADEMTILDGCQGMRMNDGPSVDEIMICVPDDDISARDYLDGV